MAHCTEQILRIFAESSIQICNKEHRECHIEMSFHIHVALKEHVHTVTQGAFLLFLDSWNTPLFIEEN